MLAWQDSRLEWKQGTLRNPHSILTCWPKLGNDSSRVVLQWSNLWATSSTKCWTRSATVSSLSTPHPELTTSAGFRTCICKDRSMAACIWTLKTTTALKRHSMESMRGRDLSSPNAFPRMLWLTWWRAPYQATRKISFTSSKKLLSRRALPCALTLGHSVHSMTSCNKFKADVLLTQDCMHLIQSSMLNPICSPTRSSSLCCRLRTTFPISRLCERMSPLSKYPLSRSWHSTPPSFNATSSSKWTHKCLSSRLTSWEGSFLCTSSPKLSHLCESKLHWTALLMKVALQSPANNVMCRSDWQASEESKCVWSQQMKRSKKVLLFQERCNLAQEMH